MSPKEKKKLLREIELEWESDSIDSHILFENENREDLEFLYVNNYLKEDFYNHSRKYLLNFTPEVQKPLTKKGRDYICPRLLKPFIN